MMNLQFKPPACWKTMGTIIIVIWAAKMSSQTIDLSDFRTIEGVTLGDKVENYSGILTEYTSMQYSLTKVLGIPKNADIQIYRVDKNVLGGFLNFNIKSIRLISFESRIFQIEVGFNSGEKFKDVAELIQYYESVLNELKLVFGEPDTSNPDIDGSLEEFHRYSFKTTWKTDNEQLILTYSFLSSGRTPIASSASISLYLVDSALKKMVLMSTLE